MAENEAAVGTNITPIHAATAVVNDAPPGYVKLFDEKGRTVLVPEEERLEWEYEHGLVTEKYDHEAAAQRWAAAYKAMPATMEQSVQELMSLGYLREEMSAALNANFGEMVDACQWYLKCVAKLFPTEAQVADIAHLKDLGHLDNPPAGPDGSVRPLHPAIRKQYEGVADKMLANDQDSLARYRSRAEAERNEIASRPAPDA